MLPRFLITFRKWLGQTYLRLLRTRSSFSIRFPRQVNKALRTLVSVIIIRRLMLPLPPKIIRTLCQPWRLSGE